MGDDGRENQDINEGIHLCWRMPPLPLRKEGSGGAGGWEGRGVVVRGDVEAFTVGRARKAFYFFLAV